MEDPVETQQATEKHRENFSLSQMRGAVLKLQGYALRADELERAKPLTRAKNIS